MSVTFNPSLPKGADAAYNHVRLASLGALLVLLALTPLAMSLLPYAGIYTEHVWKTDLTKDPAWGYRSTLIYCGLILPWVPLLHVLWCLRKPRDPVAVITSLAVWFACAVLGWRNFPYWVMGVYAETIGRVPWVDMDPKPLLDPICDGGLQFWLILATYPAMLWVPPTALVGAYLLWQRGARWGVAVPVLATSIGLYFMAFHTPQYLAWFGD